MAALPGDYGVAIRYSGEAKPLTVRRKNPARLLFDVQCRVIMEALRAIGVSDAT
jgi:hypothetical protein